jgi:hypothetical protein
MTYSPQLSSDVTSEQTNKTFLIHLSLLQFGLFISMSNSCTPVSQGEMTFTPTTDCYLRLYVACNMSLCSIPETLWRDQVVTGNAATMVESPQVQRHLATPWGQKTHG